MTGKPKLAITYCTQCNWLLRAAWMGQEVLSTFGIEMGEVSLVPGTGGIFEIHLDGVLIWERKRDGGFPDAKQIKQLVRDQIDPGRDLGHIDHPHGPAAKHDISVAVEAMPEFMAAAAAAVEARFPGTRVNAFGHLGDGNVHFNVRAPVGASPAWVEQEGAAVSHYVHDLVTRAGGSISAEHGIGQMKRAELARLADPARLHALRAIKQALDPRGIMNPGKLVPPAPLPGEG